MRERARSDEEHVKRKARQPRWPRAWSSVLTAVENGGAGRSKMVALAGSDLP